MDLDWFKFVNDAHGHKVGDELLRAVAERLLATVRDVDTVARIGGDEFGIVVQGGGAGPSDAAIVAGKLVEALGTPFVVRGLTLLIGASVGAVMFPESADTYDSVVSRASTPPCTKPKPMAVKPVQDVRADVGVPLSSQQAQA